MTRQEYLNQKPDEPVYADGRISSLEEYIDTRKQCELFEQQNITPYLTEEDYKAFDHNFDRCLESLQFRDMADDLKPEQNEIEKVQDMMELTGWKWAHSGENNEAAVPSNEQIVECIMYCYEKCFDTGHARGACATGGVAVEIDIVDHTVSVRFEHFEATSYDDED